MSITAQLVLLLQGVWITPTPAPMRATSNETIYHALVRVGQASGTPLGIVQSTNGSLCQTLTEIVPDHPSDLSSTFQLILTQAGYEGSDIEGVMVAKPTKTAPKLNEVLMHQYKSFPTLDGTIRYMGAILQGWMEGTFNGASGYALSSMSGSYDETVKLPQIVGASIQEIASRMVSLGHKGVWILSEEQDAQHELSRVKISTYSYHDDSTILDRLPCPVPVPQPTAAKPAKAPR